MPSFRVILASLLTLPIVRPLRLLIIDEIQEQNFCSFKAFDEYLKDLAVHTDRVLIVPNRYSFVNITATSLPWSRCVSSSSLPARAISEEHAGWLVSKCTENKKIKLMRCRESAESGCDSVPSGISTCIAPHDSAVDRCVRLNGLIYMRKMVSEVPELSSSIPCVTFTHLSRGILVAPNEVLCSSSRWNPLRFTSEWNSRADLWLKRTGLRSDSNSSFVAVQFRTEKWPAAIATGAACWRSIRAALYSAALSVNTTTVFIATDMVGSTSTTYLMKQTQKMVARRRFKKEVVVGLKAAGIRVVMYEQAEGAADASVVESDARHRLARSIMDLIVCSKARLFLHMYGTFGPEADAMDGCKGARAGSCFGNWIVHTRAQRHQPSRMLSSFSPVPPSSVAALHAKREENGNGGGDNTQ